jgi:hypothetical protein
MVPLDLGGLAAAVADHCPAPELLCFPTHPATSKAQPGPESFPTVGFTVGFLEIVFTDEDRSAN